MELENVHKENLMQLTWYFAPLGKNCQFMFLVALLNQEHHLVKMVFFVSRHIPVVLFFFFNIEI